MNAAAMNSAAMNVDIVNRAMNVVGLGMPSMAPLNPAPVLNQTGKEGEGEVEGRMGRSGVDGLFRLQGPVVGRYEYVWWVKRLGF